MRVRACLFAPKSSGFDFGVFFGANRARLLPTPRSPFPRRIRRPPGATLRFRDLLEIEERQVSPIQEWGLVRIDDRLIHGQVILVWIAHQKFTRIVIVDDGVAADPFLQRVLKMAAPAGLSVDVYAVTDAIRVLSQDATEHATTMVLMKTPRVARQLFDAGVAFRALNVGGIGGAPGRKTLFKNVAASPEEIAIFEYLLGKGVTITLLSVPSDKPKLLSDLIGGRPSAETKKEERR
jgi:PTS system mannose-specific IIB component